MEEFKLTDAEKLMLIDEML